jgi:FkbM family methyltransferase
MRPQKQTNTRYGNMVYFLDDPVIGRSLELYGEYCHDEIEWMKTLTNPESFVLDIGANIGTHTIGISPYVKRVMAFEPDPDNFDLLVKNVSITMCRNVTPAPAAASDVLGKVGTQFDYGKTSLIPSGDIPATPIDMIQELPRIDFVKIDVEGMELKVLNGMRQTIASYKPQMLIEMQDENVYAKTYDFLNGFGYNIYWLPVRTYTEHNHKNNTEDVFGAQHGVINWIASTIQLNTTLQAVVDRDDTVERMVWRRSQNVGYDRKNGG